jgi:hypothetical protein
MPAFKKDDDKLIYEFIKDTAPKDMFMLDVGARTGKWCKTFVTEFPEATFHCFEALPEQYIILLSAITVMKQLSIKTRTD